MPEVGETLVLRRGVIVNRSFGRFAVRRLAYAHDRPAGGLPRPAPGEPARQVACGAELLVVLDGDEYRVALDVGRRFPVRDQVWALTAIRLVGRWDFRVMLTRVA